MAENSRLGLGSGTIAGRLLGTSPTLKNEPSAAVAQERDDASKTEEPTQKRLEDAREKGQVASSREVASFLVLGAALAVWAGLGPAAAERLAGGMVAMLEGAGTLRLHAADAGRLLLAGL